MKLKILFYLCVQLFGNITLGLVSLLYTINRAPVHDVSVYYIAERIILNKDFSFFFSFISVGKFRSFKGFVKKKFDGSNTESVPSNMFYKSFKI